MNLTIVLRAAACLMASACAGASPQTPSTREPDAGAQFDATVQLDANRPIDFRSQDDVALALIEQPAPPVPGDFKIFDGKRRYLALEGDSFMVDCREYIKRKIERFLDDKNERTIIFDPKKISDQERPNIPTVALIQVRLAGLNTNRWKVNGQTQIKGRDDAANIKYWADAIEETARNWLARPGVKVIAFGSAPLSPWAQMQVDRLAFYEFQKRDSVPDSHYGIDPYGLTARHGDVSVGADLFHPSTVAAEIMAHLWFSFLLRFDGIAVPAWSEAEMMTVIERAREAQNTPLKQWQGVAACLSDVFKEYAPESPPAPGNSVGIVIKSPTIIRSFARVFKVSGPLVDAYFPNGCSKTLENVYLEGHLAGRYPSPRMNVFELTYLGKTAPPGFKATGYREAGIEGGLNSWAPSVPAIPGPDDAAPLPLIKIR